MLAIVVHASGSILAAIAFHWMSNIALSGILQPLYPAATDSAWSEVQQIHLVLLAICTPIALWLAHRRINRDAEPNGHLQQRRQHL
jgi:membrane protease YdiL (CAAX protease family)